MSPHDRLEKLASILIVNYNGGKNVQELVDALHTFPEFEIIVVDNASTDGSAAKLAQHAGQGYELIREPENRGFSYAVNRAARRAKSPYLFLVNPDVMLTKAAILRLRNTCRAAGDQAIVAPRLRNPDGSIQASCYRAQTLAHAWQEFICGIPNAYQKYLPTPGTSGVVAVESAVAAVWCVPRALWEQLGGLDERFFLYFEDLDFCDRARRAGYRVLYDARATATHVHGLSAASNPETGKLFKASAKKYHGTFKKWGIDILIRLGMLLHGQPSFKKILAIIFLQSIWIGLWAVVSYFLLPARAFPNHLLRDLYQHNFLLWGFANFDGEHYLNIATSGYSLIRGQSEYAFFPLYPLLMHALSLPLWGDVYLAGRLLSLGALVGALWYGTHWAADYLKHPNWFAWLLVFAPGAIFLHALYTESLFIMLVLGVFWYTDQRAWGKATLLTALATMTRINGIFLALFLLVKMWFEKSWRRFIYPLLGLGGLGAYSGYLAYQAHDPLAFYHAQAGWGKATATSPLATALRYGEAITVKWVPDATHLVVLIEVILTLTLLVLTTLLIRRHVLPRAYVWYTLGNVALPLATGSLGSMPRFIMTCLPIYIVILTMRAGYWRTVLIAMFVMMNIIGTMFFLRGYWYA